MFKTKRQTWIPDLTLLALMVSVTLVPAALAGNAVVLNGNDNTLAVVDLAKNEVSPNLVTFGGFPNQTLVAQGNLYVVVSGSNEVYVLERQTLRPRIIIDTGAGSNPYSVAVDAQTNIYVSLFATGEVVRYNKAGKETGRAPVGRSPEGLLLKGDRLFVANTGFRFSDFGYDPGTVSVLDTGSLETLTEIPVGLNPQWIRSTGNELHVICTGNFFSVFGEVHVLNMESHQTLAVINLGGSPGFLEVGNGRGFTSDYFGGIYSYDVATRTVQHDASNPIHFGGTGYSGLVVEDADHLLVTLYDDDVVARVDLATGNPEDLFTTGDGPVNLVMRTGNWNRRSYVPVHPQPKIVKEDRHQPGELTRNHPDLLNLRMKIRPLANPTRGTLNLAMDNASPGPVRIAIFDTNGRLVHRTMKDGAPEAMIDVASFASGIYFVRAFQNGRVANTKVVITR